MAQKSCPSGAPARAAAASIAVIPGSTRMSSARHASGPASTASNTAAAIAKTPGIAGRDDHHAPPLGRERQRVARPLAAPPGCRWRAGRGRRRPVHARDVGAIAHHVRRLVERLRHLRRDQPPAPGPSPATASQPLTSVSARRGSRGGSLRAIRVSRAVGPGPGARPAEVRSRGIRRAPSSSRTRPPPPLPGALFRQEPQARRATHSLTGRTAEEPSIPRHAIAAGDLACAGPGRAATAPRGPVSMERGLSRPTGAPSRPALPVPMPAETGPECPMARPRVCAHGRRPWPCTTTMENRAPRPLPRRAASPARPASSRIRPAMPPRSGRPLRSAARTLSSLRPSFITTSASLSAMRRASSVLGQRSHQHGQHVVAPGHRQARAGPCRRHAGDRRARPPPGRVPRAACAGA